MPSIDNDIKIIQNPLLSTILSMFIFAIIIAMVVLGVIKHKIKKRVVQIESFKPIDNESKILRKKVKNINIALGVLGGILGALIFGLFIYSSISIYHQVK